MKCRCVSQGQGGNLVAAAAALSVVMAQGKTSEELELLAALFEIIGDNLSLLALKVPSGECFCPTETLPEPQKQDRCHSPRRNHEAPAQISGTAE